MAIQQVGRQRANLDTREELIFPSTNLDSDLVHMYQLSTNTPPENLQGCYFVVVLLFARAATSYRSPMVCKWFPSAERMVFPVRTPRVRGSATQDVSVILLPKEFYRGSAFVREPNIRVTREDSRTYNLSNVLFSL